MKKKLLLLTFVFPFLTNAQTINVIGWQDGSEIVESISSEKYHELLKQTEALLRDFIISDLNELTQKSLSYQLTTICLGIGTSKEIGFGPWKFGTGFRQRFYYRR